MEIIGEKYLSCQCFYMQKIKILFGMFLKMFTFTFVIWFILNPSIEEHNFYFAGIVGLLASLFLLAISNTFISPKIFDFFFKKDFYKYILFMIKEIALSSYGVVKCILTMKKYNSKIVEINVPQGISLGKTLLLSSSITLTPGTSVVLIEGGKIYIHCFQDANASVQDGDFVKKVLSFNF